MQPQVPPPPPVPYAVSRPPKWLWLLPVLSCGLLSFVPPIAIATKAGSARAWSWAGGFSAAWLAGFSMVGVDDNESALSDVGMTIYFAVWIGAIIYSLVQGPKVAWPSRVTYVMPPPPIQPAAYPPAHPYPQPLVDPNAAAIDRVQAGRRKRDEARELARRDPAMARDLRIGRPDLPRQYDDGGLVDVNSAPAEVVSQMLGLTSEQAAQLVDARQTLGRFEHVEDLVNLAGLDPRAYDQVKDRIVLL